MNLTKQLTTTGESSMKRTWDNRRKSDKRSLTGARFAAGGEIQRALNRAKTALLNEYAELAGEHGRLLRLALNEAEALAWQTAHPHLFFPALAAEKAQATVAWHERQRALRRGELERAFAE
jgi:hypothetical protein